MTPEVIGAKIIERASQFLGLHETAANAAWDNPATAGKDKAADELLQALQATGWQKGWPYCIAFCEAIWRSAYVDLGAPPALLLRISRLVTPSVIQTYNQLGAEAPSLITRTPKPGAIYLLQSGNKPLGHAGIYVRGDGAQFAGVEGNTSPAPGTAEADREGDGVFRKTRRVDYTPRAAGLWLRGFFNPLPW